MDNYSAMEAKIKALESEIEHLKRVNQLNEENFKAQINILNEEIKNLNSLNGKQLEKEKIEQEHQKWLDNYTSEDRFFDEEYS